MVWHAFGHWYENQEMLQFLLQKRIQQPSIHCLLLLLQPQSLSLTASQACLERSTS